MTNKRDLQKQYIDNKRDLYEQQLGFALSNRAYRKQQLRKSIFAGIAREIRKAAKSYHVLIDECAGARHKRKGVVECKKCGYYFKFTAKDAEKLFANTNIVQDVKQLSDQKEY